MGVLASHRTLSPQFLHSVTEFLVLFRIVLDNRGKLFYARGQSAVHARFQLFHFKRGIKLICRLKRYHLSFKLIKLCEAIVSKTAANLFSVLSNLHDLFTLEASLTYLELELVFKGLEIVQTCLVIQCLIDSLYLFLYTLHPLVQCKFKLLVV